MSKQPSQKSMTKAKNSAGSAGSGQKSQHGTAKQQVVERVVVKEIRREASAHSQRYAGFLVCPYDADEVVDAPSLVPVRRTTVRQNLTVDLATYNAAGKFFLEVFPQLTKTLAITSATADVPGADNFMLSASYDNVNDNSNWPSDGQLAHTTTGNVASLQNITAASGQIKQAFAVVTGGGVNTVWNYVLTVPSSPISALIEFRIQTTTGATWSDATVFSVNVSATGGNASGTVTIPTGCVGLTLQARMYGQPVGCDLQAGLSLQWSSGAGTLGLASNFLMQDTLGLPLAQSINDLESWAVVAQDVLVTFEGDTLNDGGAIAAARVPRSWSTNGDPYSEIIGLPYDRYDGPLKYGAHVHWIPGSLDDLKPVVTAEDASNFGAFKMVVAGTITHPGASVRVRVCTVISYYSSDPSYGTMDWAPPPTDYLLLLQYVARAVPAATQNDTHVLKRLAMAAGKHAKQGFKYLLENPEQLAKLAAMIAAVM